MVVFDEDKKDVSRFSFASQVDLRIREEPRVAAEINVLEKRKTGGHTKAIVFSTNLLHSGPIGRFEKFKVYLTMLR